MDLDYGSLPRVLLVLTIKCLTKVLEEWPEEFRGPNINPHLDYLFTIRDDDDQELQPKEL